MKTILALALLLTSLISASKADDIDDIFNTGNGEFKFERFSNEGILLAIDKDAKIACMSNGQCVLSSVKSDSNGWEVSFNVGQGNNINSNGGTTIITGGYDTGKTNTCNTCNGVSWGVTLAYKVGHCTQTVMVPRSLYYALNRYMYGLMQETGETKKGFTPADEAMIMFYTTIAKQASGCSTGK
ncbi:MAG: hypothetical protein PHY93_08310 [Bacteriovorax sp.]|nr:hypothetical protein [Bacteriovorax sp.]